MIDDVFVVDATTHSYNYLPDNNAAGHYSEGVTNAIFGAHYALSPAGYRIPREHYVRDWGVDEAASMMFLESDYDIACHHVLALTAYKDGGSGLAKAREARKRWPQRFQVYAGVDPMFPEAAVDSLEQQVEELAPIGLKLYPNSYSASGVRGWHMDDPEIAFPLFQKCLDLGIKVVAIHKAVPLGPVPMEHYRMDDIDAAADAFPDLQFEVVHGGAAFVEETAFQLARFSNVWVNLEITASLACAKPAAFVRIMADLVSQAGPDALQRIIWATGASVWHPDPPLQWFWEKFGFSEQQREGEGLPEITPAVKRAILGQNWLSMHGLDEAVLAAGIAGDEFAIERARGKADPYSTTLSKGVAE
ncbi:amidohydrolase family protein [Gordonia mangrovi]|nr:amidohydrolase family protein [Gordonia mangrovi]UVF80188.1 amidohydrolase [Gordonia mangrovi]